MDTPDPFHPKPTPAAKVGVGVAVLGLLFDLLGVSYAISGVSRAGMEDFGARIAAMGSAVIGLGVGLVGVVIIWSAGKNPSAGRKWLGISLVAALLAFLSGAA